MRPGHHMLTAQAANGFGKTSAMSAAIQVMVVDRLGSVSGTVFLDADGNGERNSEVGVPTTVFAIPAAEPTKIIRGASDSNGAYSFVGLIPGDYLIQLAVPQNHIMSAGMEHYSRVAVPPGPPTVVDFALSTITPSTAASVSGAVYADENSNSTMDPGEEVRGVSIVTYDLLTGKTSNTVTGSDGRYSISGLTPITTLVQTNMLPAGYIPVDDSSFYTYAQLRSGLATADFVLNRITNDEMATLTGSIHEDDNANGLRDRGEAGFGGTEVHVLELSTGTLVTTTDRRGNFMLTSLLPGTVLVYTGLLPEDHIPQVGFTNHTYQKLGVGETTSINFPMRHIYQDDTATVSGTVYRDANANGVLESSENGIQGVHVKVILG